MADGFLLIDKENTWSSRDICNKIQGLFHQKKVGHIGTLDPFATGLLIVSLGKATKAGQFLEASDKTYLAKLKLGESKDGGDLTGDTIEIKDVPTLKEDQIIEVLNSFVGEIDQVPPLKSAVHYKGMRLYEYAYNNQVITPPSRKVTINSISFISYEDNVITFRCNVGKGTYIRVLGEDIAKKLNTLGHLIELRREKVSFLDVKDAYKMKDIDESKLISISDALVNIQHIFISDTLENKAKNGLSIYIKEEGTDDIILLVNKNNVAIAVYERKEANLYKPVRGLF